ncbi:sugar-binding transcriptional regulator [Paraburkholderia saeva]|uniref:Erythritol catabolism regulatory protein EryD n=1 Tax=Paraburkholderia saeva TaxID=2777537 RepID=A0A9N8RTS1_9BURK|nr:sugar-binding transcriptional regulator [Paraburkholderia saeva]CAG4890429.1 Erythritol catabolism regulatory protein EryD [Paraburkholderia saeva]CAG4893569.1 Erythritol catabolism regulatory protein EryD [Paraburkholderia saeva]CAG4916048.1 Erythritol catabolism regulatory protein EryD [Paraburkholderia saeva]
MSRSTEKLDLATRAAWLYYVAGNTQNEIAEKLQVSRPVAQRLVAFAVEKNLIRVRVDHQLADCLALADQLSKRYGLSFCEIVPVDDDTPEEIDRKLAVAGAQVMERYLLEEKPMIVAVSSGRTLKAAVDQIAQLDRPQHRLVSMVGAIAQDGSSNRYDVALHISEKTGGKHFLLPAPLIADNEAERAQWVNHRLYRIVESLSGSADVAFVGIGNIGPNCPLHEDGFITSAEVKDLVQRGAVAEMLGLPINASGARVVSPTGNRVTSLYLDSPPKRPTIGFAGGERKRDAVIAALKGGWLSGLVTDERCARAALEDGTQETDKPARKR